MNRAPHKIRFVKMTGAGNDFVLIDETEARALGTDWSQAAPFLCSRRYGIGADGLLILEPSQRDDFRMEYYNSDGSSGGMCGNGGRCAALFYMLKHESRETTFEALGDSYAARSAGSAIILKMRDPSDIRLRKNLQVLGENLTFHFVNTGAPHAAAFVDQLTPRLRSSISSYGILELGRAIRHHDMFKPEGTNVDFIELLSGGAISMRTYERGVEDETLACGTGAVACSIIGSLVRGLRPPIQVRTHGGELLHVDFHRTGERIENVELEGPVKVVYHGEIDYPGGAEAG